MGPLIYIFFFQSKGDHIPPTLINTRGSIERIALQHIAWYIKHKNCNMTKKKKVDVKRKEYHKLKEKRRKEDIDKNVP